MHAYEALNYAFSDAIFGNNRIQSDEMECPNEKKNRNLTPNQQNLLNGIKMRYISLSTTLLEYRRYVVCSVLDVDNHSGSYCVVNI